MTTYILTENAENTRILKERRERQMKPDRKKAVGAAVARLVEAKDYRVLKAQLLRMVQHHAALPLRFAGELEVLNPLLEIGISNPLQFEQIFNLITLRRRARALYYEETRRTKRNDYMKEYMRNYRAAQKKASRTVKAEVVREPPPKGKAAPKNGNDQELNAILS